MAASTTNVTVPSGTATKIATSVRPSQRGYVTVTNDSGANFRIAFGSSPGAALDANGGHPLNDGVGVTASNEISIFHGSEEIWVFQNSGSSKTLTKTEGV